MTHDQYIRNINYKIDSLFNEYDEISTNINILAINSNHMLINEGYTVDDIYYDNIDYMIEATEAKKGILGKIIDGIMKIIRTIVDKVKSFFSKNKPDPKAKVSVSKSLESRTNKLIKLKPKILKCLALAGTVGAGALAVSKISGVLKTNKSSSGGVVPSKNSDSSNGVMNQGSTDGPTKQNDVNAKNREELEKIANEVKNEVEDVKEDKKKDSKENKSNATEFEFDTVKVTQRIKELTEVLVKINEHVTDLSKKLSVSQDASNLDYTVRTCNNYVSEVNDTVDEMIYDLYNNTTMLDGTKGYADHSKVTGFVNKSSEMREFNRTKDETMSNIDTTQSRAVEIAKSKLGPAFDELERINREKKLPEGKTLFNALKKLQHLALKPDKYPRDEYINEYARLVDDVINPMFYNYNKLNNSEYMTITDKIKRLTSTIYEYNVRKMGKK